MKRRLLLMFSLIIGLAACKKESSQQSQSFNQTPVILSSPAKTATTNKIATGGSTTCTTIQSFSAKEGKIVGSTITHTIEISYSVKPCDATQNLSATVEVYNFNTGELEFQFANLPRLSGKVLYAGASLGLHTVVLKSVDANTGTVIESQQTVIAVTVKAA